jgi:hypothetical protein
MCCGRPWCDRAVRFGLVHTYLRALVNTFLSIKISAQTNVVIHRKILDIVVRRPWWEFSPCLFLSSRSHPPRLTFIGPGIGPGVMIGPSSTTGTSSFSRASVSASSSPNTVTPIPIVRLGGTWFTGRSGAHHWHWRHRRWYSSIIPPCCRVVLLPATVSFTGIVRRAARGRVRR